MTYLSKPWTSEPQEPEALKKKREEIQAKEIASKNVENLPVAVSRIVKFLDQNKTQKYTNKQIALEMGLSESTVSGITEKLEEIGILKHPKGYRSLINHRPTITYQSAKGYSGESTIEREYEGCIAKVLGMFEKNINKIYSKKVISKELGVTKEKVGQALSILLITKKVKAVGIEEGALTYQSIKGKEPAIKIGTEPDNSYITFGNYLKTNNIKGNIKELKEKVAAEKGHSRLFYSDKGIVKEYELSYLQKVLGLGEGKKEKKGFLERIKVW